MIVLHPSQSVLIEFIETRSKVKGSKRRLRQCLKIAGYIDQREYRNPICSYSDEIIENIFKAEQV
ncbi:hypothetical protein [Pelosinus baikalensis]|uniref:Uncharacterized protein n=1 Tax=Pelosinus baikalensis TaxID=2892015 RepID=A0ABS8HZ85_9FIRM|nr:hypothetical protein [Pelosinus baikalensis]MCC5468453.1 hypothetical protein [Pelosinus baikalensis]